MSVFCEQDVFLVTGASSGIGEGVAQLLCERGATIVACGRNAERLSALREKTARPEAVYLERKDLSENIAALPDWLKTLKGRYGRFKGLAHCAGISRTEPVRMIEYESLKSMFDDNFFSALMLAKGFIDRRINAGPGSAMVMFSSIAAVQPAKGQAAYGASKAALATALKALSKEIAPQGLRVNCIAPALIETPMTEEFLRQYGQDFDPATYPLGLGKVEDAASLAVFLISDEAKWITGQNYLLDGGASR